VAKVGGCETAPLSCGEGWHRAKSSPRHRASELNHAQEIAYALAVSLICIIDYFSQIVNYK
jgi:hypothetical protein